MKWMILVVLVGCLKPNHVICDDGRTCPGGLACDDVHELCVLSEQLTTCAGKPDGSECDGDIIDAHCHGEVCLPAVCGDAIQEFGEVCDDGNVATDDTCSADCLSNMKCGNTIVDTFKEEQCDDGNRIDHDGCSSTCKDEVPHWVEHTLLPGARGFLASAYDYRRDRIVVFGGQNSSMQAIADTLEWNGIDWARIDTPTSPSPRTRVSMAFDGARGETVMFGGFDGTWDLSDTWLWDGARWRSADAGGPKERYGQVMVYDPIRKVVVLFGGWNDYDGQLRDTWEWNGETWTEITTIPVPPKREYAGAAFDPKLGKIVLVGGYNQVSGALADTWTYDGAWTDITPAGPHPAVSHAAVTYNLAAQTLTLVAGQNTAGQAQQTVWTFSGTSWTNAGAAPLSVRITPAMQSNATQVVLFGGYNAGNYLDDTWVLTGTTWAAPASPVGRRRMASTNDLGNRTAWYFGGVDDSNTLRGDTWELSSTGFVMRSGSPPSSRQSVAMVFDEKRGKRVLFGGSNVGGFTVYGDTWIGTGTTWTNPTLGIQPPARYRASITFDGTNVLLFGGNSSSTNTATLGDFWRWDGSIWNELTPSAKPTARWGAAMGYDPIRNEVVLFGGFGTNTHATGMPTVELDDTWVFKNMTWTEIPTLYRPAKRTGGALLWNAARQRLTLVAGSTSVTDAYEWNGEAGTWSAIPAVNTPTGRPDASAITSFDGSGVFLYSGANVGTSWGTQRWELRYDGPTIGERCDGTDLDEDDLVDCADPDCWSICTPYCPPGTTCDMAAPRCGDSMCAASRESCRTCETDCGPCPAVCGDHVCDMAENLASCPGDCTP